MVTWMIVASLLVGGAGFWSGVRFNGWRLRIWQKAVAACGLEVVKISHPLAWRLRLTARSGPLAVLVEDTNRRGNPGSRMVVTVPGPPGFLGLRIRRQTVKPAREIEVGDEAFDDAFWIEGPLRLVTALLDFPTRRLIARAVVECELTLAGGDLEAYTFDARVPEVLPKLVELGKRFTEPLDVAQRVADNALQDPEAGVRLRNLLLLVREFPGEPATLEVLRAACADWSSEIRLRAAMELGAEGREVLFQLTESDEDDAVSAQAVSLLGRELPFARTQAILTQALRIRRLQTARACLESMGTSGDAAAVEVLAKVLARETGELAVAAAEALGATGSPAAEAPLIAALERDKTDLRVAAATALASVGSAASVPALREAAEGSLFDRELRRAARQAIAEIQARVPGASPGQLSLAGVEAGQLSLAQAEAGQVSLAHGQEGKLSLAEAEAGQLSLAQAEAGQLSDDPVGQTMPAAQSERGTGDG